MQPEIFSGLFGRGGVAAAVSAPAWLQAMLDFESALAGALAEVGLAPPEAAERIAAECRAELYDPAELGAGAAGSGTPVPALLAAIGARLDPVAAGVLHRGATSQDVVDTAAMLVARRALAPLLADLGAAAATAADLAERHRGTLQPGRTLLQQALPVSFGLKAAGWMGGLEEAALRLAELREAGLAVQMGGAAGTLASLGADGVAVAAALARRLELAAPALPWQANRVRPALLAGALGAAAGAAGKVGIDVVGLAQTEVGEVSEGGGGGDSSTLPQKRNPVAAVAAVACAKRTPALVATLLAAMPGEQERAAGAWQTEAETLSELLRLTGSAAAASRDLLEGLEVDASRMRSNLELTKGLAMAESLSAALTPSLGRETAHHLVEAASTRAIERRQPLVEAAAAEPEIVATLGERGIAAALDPEAYLGSSEELIDRALAARRARRERS